jgi:hypothetical protein
MQQRQVEPYIDQHSEEILSAKKINLDNKFSSKSKEILAIAWAWIVTKNTADCDHI